VALTTPLTSAAAMSAAIDAAPSVPIHDGTEEPETVDVAPAAAVKPELVVEAPPDVAETPGSGVTNPTGDPGAAIGFAAEPTTAISFDSTDMRHRKRTTEITRGYGQFAPRRLTYV